MTVRFVLASASPARLRLLTSAGIEADVVPSGVDEDDVAEAGTAAIVAELAGRKARAVAGRVEPPALVLGCDSLLDLDGVPLGKPRSAAEAVSRWQRMAGAEGHLLTGHHLIDVATGAEAAAVGDTVVRFGTPTADEVEAYVASGEPLAVAGAFTLDGLGAPFVEGIDGDAGNVIGVSLPLLRRLLAELGVGITELWAR